MHSCVGARNPSKCTQRHGGRWVEGAVPPDGILQAGAHSSVAVDRLTLEPETITSPNS